MERISAGKTIMECGPPGRMAAIAQAHFFYQPRLEAAMAERVAEFSNITVLSGHEVLQVLQNENVVQASVRQRDCHAPKIIESKYLIGAGGANSGVRKHIGSEWLFRPQRTRLAIGRTPAPSRPGRIDTVRHLRLPLADRQPAYLARPDGQVYGSARSGADLGALVGR